MNKNNWLKELQKEIQPNVDNIIEKENRNIDSEIFSSFVDSLNYKNKPILKEVKSEKLELPNKQSKVFYVDKETQAFIVRCYMDNRPNHWYKIDRLQSQVLQRLNTTLIHTYEGDVTALLTDFIDAVKWINLDPYWQSNQGGIYSLVNKENFVQWGCNYRQSLENLVKPQIKASSGGDYSLEPIQSEPDTEPRIIPDKFKILKELRERNQNRVKNLISEKTKKREKYFYQVNERRELIAIEIRDREAILRGYERDINPNHFLNLFPELLEEFLQKVYSDYEPF